MKTKQDQTVQVKIRDCIIVKEGGTYKIIHEGKEIHHDWYSEDYDWLGLAYSIIQTMREQYHTIELLTLLRQALREDCVQGWGLQDEMIFDFIDEKNKLTKRQFDIFVKQARMNDKVHHRCHTF